MKKILIINLKRLGDIYSSAHLVNSILYQNPSSEISLLTYDEGLVAAQNVKGVFKTYTIDRKKIITMSVNKIFSDALAIEKFYQSLSPLKEQQWDEIINYSNDEVSSYISSFLSTTITGVKIGPSFDHNMSLSVNSEWDHLFNDVVTQSAFSPLHFQDCYHQMCSVPLNQEGEKLKFNPKHNQNAFNNLQKLRSHFDSSEEVFLVGLQLSSSSSEKSPHIETYIKLIKIMMSTSHYVPILLVAPTTEDRELASSINKTFKNKLVTAEADLSALASVLLNVDLLVTPDTVTKHIADLTETACLEISMGEAPFLKQGTRFSKSLILTSSLKNRLFSNSIPNLKQGSIKDQRDLIGAEDIYCCLEFMLRNEQTLDAPNLKEGLSLYKPVQDELGVRYDVFAGDQSFQQELKRLTHRTYIFQLFGKGPTPLMQAKILELSRLSIDNKTWIEDEKTTAANSTKDLLATLRSLLLYQDNSYKVNDFISSLDKLLDFNNEVTMSSIAKGLFKGRLESLSPAPLSQNIKKIEAILYQLKTDLQLSFNCLKDIEDAIAQDRKQRSKIKPNRDGSHLTA